MISNQTSHNIGSLASALKFLIHMVGLDKKIFERKIVNIFLSISFNLCLGAQKNRLIETVF